MERQRVEDLQGENRALRARLAHLEAMCSSPPPSHQRLSDTEKLLLSRATSASAPPSIAGTEPPSPHGAPSTPEWDHQSLGSCSEVSVAGLQDRILQMEETHYSTSEELQATLQELADLQTQLADLQSDNARLTDEKAVVLQSLCKQTERLEDCRARVESLTGLLCTEGLPAPTDTEARLLELIKGLQEERSEQQAAAEAQAARLRASQERLASAEHQAEHQAERVAVLQAQVEAGTTERKRLEERLEAATHEAQEKAIEHDRLETLLASARAKIEELEESLQSPGDATALEARLESARAERGELEARVAELQEQLARAQGEATRLRDAANSLQEECKVGLKWPGTMHAPKCLNWSLCWPGRERNLDVRPLQHQSRQRRPSATLKARGSCGLSCVKPREKPVWLEKKLPRWPHNWRMRNGCVLRRTRSGYSSDLLMTVRVANEFKTEAQQQLESLVLENKTLKERNRSLDSELTRTRGEISY
ncbi:hypothetical protein B566_EDAN011646 [Ephemera danica]|nr:hypothetical protein B566_EDAN011646 [Ephemera danica]